MPVARQLTTGALLLCLVACTPDAPGPEASASTTPTPHGEGALWPVVDRASVDLDGDGTDEQVRLRVAEVPLVPKAARVEAVLSGSDDVSAVVVRRTALDYSLGGTATDLDADGTEEVLLLADRAVVRNSAPAVTVVVAVAGDLAVARAPEWPELGTSYDDRMHRLTWWVRGRQLFSTRSQVRFEVAPGGHDVLGPEQYAVTLWEWQLDGLTLDPGPGRARCMRAGALESPFPCPKRR